MLCHIWVYWCDDLVERCDSKRETDWYDEVRWSIWFWWTMEFWSLNCEFFTSDTIWWSVGIHRRYPLNGFVTLPRRFRFGTISSGEVSSSYDDVDLCYLLTCLFLWCFDLLLDVCACLEFIDFGSNQLWLIDFDLTVSIVHPMGGGLQLVFFGYPSDRGIRKGQSCSSTLLRYYGTANYMLPLETHINQGYPLWFVAISGHINTQINSNRVNYTGILECIVNHSKKTC